MFRKYVIKLIIAKREPSRGVKIYDVSVYRKQIGVKPRAH
jgi:hypothetical protein